MDLGRGGRHTGGDQPTLPQAETDLGRAECSHHACCAS